jgi:hypothetical protein
LLERDPDLHDACLTLLNARLDMALANPEGKNGWGG